MNKNITIQDVYNQVELNVTSSFNEPRFYINRELSWIEFNKRVLHQTIRKGVPLLEKTKFLGITASNLDEFIMVRFASVLNKIMGENKELDISGLTPEEEYQKLLKEIISFKKIQQEVYGKLLYKLFKKDIIISKFNELSDKEKSYVERLFFKNIYPLLTPITIDTTKDFPLIRSKQLCILVGLSDNVNQNLSVLSIIPIDNGLERLYKIETDEDEDKYILLEEIIFNFLDKLFMNKVVDYKGCFRILRQADIELERNEDVYIIDRMKQTLLKRELSEPIFMDVSSDIPKQFLKILTRMFNIEKPHIFKCDIVDLSFLAKGYIKKPVLEYEPFSPQYPEELISEHDMFTAIDNGDILLHHPYETFGPVVKFLEHSSEDKDVLAIKMTLYRVSSSESPIVNALCKAAQNGKQVSVLLEIKARFDEERNMSLIEKLKISGCKIIYGFDDLKTHCKFILVVRRNKKGNLKTYCHIGTGNYNDSTAKIYTDFSYFTDSNKIGEDLISIFNILSGFSEPREKINKIFYSPFNIRTRFYEMVDREIENASRGKEAYIFLKLNSLSDKGVIRKLYEASEKGVKVRILCRGICSMKPINKNIVIKSIIGRYLEHSRIYYFHNGGKEEVFISSADMLTRNLDRRLEIMVPITENDVREKLLNIVKRYWDDTFNCYKMNEDGTYYKVNKRVQFNCHEYFMKEAIENFKLRRVPKITMKNKK
ncbi:MAG: polyphosphate kinase 1 [Brevinematia bacterium]